MPAICKKRIVKNARTESGREWLAVCLLLLLLAVSLFSGCAQSKDADVFLTSEAFAEETLTGQAVCEAAASDEAGCNETAYDNTAETETDREKEASLLVVHICGAVINPGVYALPEGSRVVDVLEAAGGFTPDAATDARNLAEYASDGCMIRIPTKQEAKEEQQNAQHVINGGNQSAAAGNGLVNINLAGADLLKTLPGIGESRAEAIIAYRTEHGAFASIEDIMKVSGIKRASFDKLKDRITVR